jgi:hypothetical protein
MQTAPKYEKIELRLRARKQTYLNCGMVITGDHIIVVTDTIDSVHNNTVSTGDVYPLSDVIRYKTYAK